MTENRMNEHDARRAGLRLVQSDELVDRPTAGDRVRSAATRAEAIAAEFDQVVRTGQMSTRQVWALRDALGELHVDLELTAEEVGEVAA